MFGILDALGRIQSGEPRGESWGLIYVFLKQKKFASGMQNSNPFGYFSRNVGLEIPSFSIKEHGEPKKLRSTTYQKHASPCTSWILKGVFWKGTSNRLGLSSISLSKLPSSRSKSVVISDPLIQLERRPTASRWYVVESLWVHCIMANAEWKSLSRPVIRHKGHVQCTVQPDAIWLDFHILMALRDIYMILHLFPFDVPVESWPSNHASRGFSMSFADLDVGYCGTCIIVAVSC